MEQARYRQIYLEKARQSGGLRVGGAKVLRSGRQPGYTGRKCAVEGKHHALQKNRCLAYYHPGQAPAGYEGALNIGVVSPEQLSAINDFRKYNRNARSYVSRNRKRSYRNEEVPLPQEEYYRQYAASRRSRGQHVPYFGQGRGGNAPNRRAAAKSPWINFVRQWAADHRMSYSMALRDHGAQVSADYHAMGY